MAQSYLDASHYTISPATEEQRLEIIKLSFHQWGNPDIGLDFFTQCLSDIDTHSHTKDERQTYWVLVPEGEESTLDILSCCRTHRRDAAILHANANNPIGAFGYAIGNVITPKEYRGRGYAHRMLTLLHHALAPGVYAPPGVDIRIPPSVYPGVFSVLYSDVGNYYERCGPTPGEAGWKVQGPISTFWKLPETLSVLMSYPDTSQGIKLLSEKEVASLLSSDVPDWKAMQRAPDTAYVAFSPSALSNSRWVVRSTIHPTHKAYNVCWGAQIDSQNDFITWAFDYHTKPRSLVITRLRADSSTFPALLHAALRAGQIQACEQAEVWNLPEELSKEATRLGGATSERSTHLPAIRWYGPEAAQNVVWLRNEYYSYTAA